MTQIIRLFFCIPLSFLFGTVGYAQQQDSVTISGRVTDFNGQPIDSCSVCWYTPRFNPVSEGITNKDGYTLPGYLKENIKVYMLSTILLCTHSPQTWTPRSGTPFRVLGMGFYCRSRHYVKHTISSYGSLWNTCFPHPRRYACLSDICPPHESDTLLRMDEDLRTGFYCAQ